MLNFICTSWTQYLKQNKKCKINSVQIKGMCLDNVPPEYWLVLLPVAIWRTTSLLLLFFLNYFTIQINLHMNY